MFLLEKQILFFETYSCYVYYDVSAVATIVVDEAAIPSRSEIEYLCGNSEVSLFQNCLVLLNQLD